MQMKDTRCQLN